MLHLGIPLGVNDQLLATGNDRFNVAGSGSTQLIITAIGPREFYTLQEEFVDFLKTVLFLTDDQAAATDHRVELVVQEYPLESTQPSSPVVIEVMITPTNDRPVILSTQRSHANLTDYIPESNNRGFPPSFLIDETNIEDIDLISPVFIGLAITGYTDADSGSWMVWVNDIWTSLANVSECVPQLVSPNGRIRFVPSPNPSKTDTLVSLVYRAWDGSSEMIDCVQNTPIFSEQSPISAENETFIYYVEYLNRAPTVAQIQYSLPNVEEDETYPRSIEVSSITDIVGRDVDDLYLGLALTSVDSTNGVWQYQSSLGNWTEFPVGLSPEWALLLDNNSRVRFLPNHNYFGMASFEALVWDMTEDITNTTQSDPFTGAFSIEYVIIIVSVDSINDIPVVELGIPVVSYTENEPPVKIFSNLTISDEDSSQLAWAVVILECPLCMQATGSGDIGSGINLYSTSTDVILVVPSTSNFVATVEDNVDTMQKVVTIMAVEGTDNSPAEFASYLETIYFSTTSPEPSNAPRIVTVIVSDGLNESVPISVSINILLVNDDTPSVSLPYSSIMWREDSGPLQLFSSPISIIDHDDNTLFPLAWATLELKNHNPDFEYLAINCSLSSLTCSYENNTLTLSGQQNIDVYEQIISEVYYINSNPEPADYAREVHISVFDGSFSSPIVQLVVEVELINDQLPIIQLAQQDILFQEPDTNPITTSIRVATNLTIIDTDSRNFHLHSATVTIINPLDGESEGLKLAYPNINVTGQFQHSLTILCEEGVPLMILQDALREVEYFNSAEQLYETNRTIEITVADELTLDGVQYSDSVFVDVSFVRIDDLPEVRLHDNILLYNEGQSPQQIDVAANAELIDVDSSQLSGLDIYLTTNSTIDTSLDRLEVNLTGFESIITQLPSGNFMRISLVGESSLIDYMTVLRTLTYQHSDTTGDPDTGLRTVTVIPYSTVGEEGISDSVIVAFSAVNNPPVVDLNGNRPGLNNIAYFPEESQDPVLITDAGVTISDVDSEELVYIKITLLNALDGEMERIEAYSGGLDIVEVNTTYIELRRGLPSQYRAVLLNLTYYNRADEPNRVTRIVSVEVNDGELSGYAEIEIVITPQNDVPEIILNSTEIVYVEEETIKIAAGVQVVDPDSYIVEYRVRPVQVYGGDLVSGPYLLYADEMGAYIATFNNTSPELAAEIIGMITFTNTQAEPIASDRVFCISVRDTELALSPEACVTVTVQVINDNPPVFDQSLYQAMVVENHPNELVAQITALDADSVNSNVILVYSITSGDDCPVSGNIQGSGSTSDTGPLVPQDELPCRFQIDSMTGELTTTSTSPDREERDTYTLTITASDGELSAVTELYVTITDENDNAPMFVPDYYEAAIPVDAMEGYEVIQLMIVDPDLDSDFTPILISMFPNIGREVFIRDPNDLSKIILNRPERELDANVDQYILTFEAIDSALTTSTNIATLVVNITQNQQSPVFSMDSYTAMVSEAVSDDFIVHSVYAVDNDPGYHSNFTFSILESDVPFAINAQNGDVFVLDSTVIDFEAVQEYVFTVIATDTGRPQMSSSAHVRVEVINVNDNPPVFDRDSSYVVEVCEGAPIGYVFLELLVEDIDGDVLSYDLIEMSGCSQCIAINSSTGILTVARELDFEDQQTISFSVLVNDLLFFSDEIVTVHILNDNEAPPEFSFQSLTIVIPETQEPGSYLPLPMANIPLASDTDACNIDHCDGTAIISNQTCIAENRLYYEITSGNEQGLFEIDPSLGLVSVSQVLDVDMGVQQEFNLTLIVTDGQFTDVAYLIIAVTDINDNLPEFQNESYTVTVPEDTAVGTTIITTLATDMDPTDILQYSLIDEENPGYFNITDTGDIFIIQPLDFESISRYSIIITVTDRPYITNATAVPVLLSVFISDVNDNAPIFLMSDITFVVIENSSPGTIGSVQATDVDPVNLTLSYYITSSTPDDGGFMIDAVSGQVLTTRPLDHETINFYEIIITAVDNGIPQLSTNISIDVMVLNENESPPQFIEGIPSNVTISESAEIGRVVITLTAFDEDYTDVGFKIVGGDNVTFNLRSVDTVSEGSASATEGMFPDTPYTQSTELILTQELDYEETREYNIVVGVFDIPTNTIESMSLSSTIGIKIIVTDENDNPPIFTETTYKTQIPELSETGTFVLQLLATDDDIGTNAIIQYGIEETLVMGESLFLLNNITGIINVDTSELLTIDLLGQNYSVAVYAYNTEPPYHQSTATVVIQLIDVNNNAPYFETSDIAFTITEDFTPVVLESESSSDDVLPSSFSGSGETEESFRLISNVAAFDSDEGINAQLRFSLLSGSDLFFIDPLSGDLFVIGTLDREQQDEYIINVHVTDLGVPPLENMTSILVRVTDINDNAPMFLEDTYSGVVLENMTIGIDILPLSAIDADIGMNADIIFSVVNEGGTVPFQVDPLTGVIQTAEPLDRETQESHIFQVEARNGDLFSLATVLIRVEGINEFHPVISPNILHTNLSENIPTNTIIHVFIITDEDTGVGENSTISLRPSTNMFSIDEHGVLIVTGHIDYEMIQNTSLEIIVRNLDIPHFETIANVFISVINQNDNPPIVEYGKSSVLYDELIQRHITLNVGITISDADGREFTRIVDGIVKFENEYIEPSFAYESVTVGEIVPVFGCSLEVNKILKFQSCGIPDVALLSRYTEGILQLHGGLIDGENVLGDSIVFDASLQQYATYIDNVGTLESNGLTISMWVWFEPTGSSEPLALLSKISSSQLLYGVFCNSDGSLVFSFTSSDLEQHLMFTDGCSALEGAWHHLGIVVDNRNIEQWTLNVFIDGFQFGSADIVQPFDSTGGFLLGATRASLNSLTTNFFNGRIHMLVVSLSSSDLNNINCVIGCGLVIISNENSVLTHSYNYSQRALIVQETQSIDVYEDFLNSLTIVLPFIEPSISQYMLSYTVQDEVFNCLPTFIDIIVVASNDFRPELSLNGAISRDYYAYFVEEGGPVAIVNTTSFYLMDMDLIEFNYVVTASIIDPLQSFTEELLSVNNFPEGMNVTYVNHTLILTGLFPLPMFEAVLRTITYDNTADEPVGLSREISITISDPPQPDTSAQTMIEFIFLNDHPAIELVSSLIEYSEGDGAVLILDSVAIDDSDDPNLSSANITFIPLNPGMEFLTVDTSNTNITAAYDLSTATLTLTGSDTQQNYASVLQSIRYEHIGMANPSLGTRVFTFVISDGKVDSLPRSLYLFFAAVNDAPVINLSGRANFNHRVNFEEDTDDVISIVSSNATILDIDGDHLVWIYVQLINPQQEESVIVPTPTISSIQVTQFNTSFIEFTPTSGDNAPVSDFEAILRTVQYQNTAEEPSPGIHTIQFIANDGMDISVPAFSEINVIAVNDRPILNLDTDTPGTGYVTDIFEEGGNPVNITGRRIELFDNDVMDSVEMIMITIQLAVDGLDERIISNYPNTTLPSPANGQSVTYIIDARHLTTDPITYLKSLQYFNTRVEPTPGVRTISVSVSDGTEFSNTAIVQLSVMGVNENVPQFTMNMYTFMIEESLAASTPVGNVSARDIDDGVDGIISYEITSSIPLEGVSHFTIDFTSGLISSEVELDWEEIKLYELIILARDGGLPQRTANATVTIGVIDINDNPPVFYPNSNGSIDITILETIAVNEVIETVQVIDPDSEVDFIAVTLVNGTEVPFEIGVATHEIRVSRNLDVDTQSLDGCINGGIRYNLLLKATDFHPPMPFSTTIISIHVEDVNDNEPQFVSYTNFTIFENDENLYLFSVTAIDRDCTTNAEITYTFQDSSTYNLFNISEYTGAVTSLMPLDREVRDIYLFTVVATDNGMPRQSASTNITLQVLDVNDNAPSFEEAVYEFVVDEDKDDTFSVTAVDIDAGASGVVESYSLDLYTVPVDPLTNKPFFTIDSLSGYIMFNGTDVDSEVEFEASYTLTVYAIDAGSPSLTGTGTVIIYVVDINDNAPVVNTTSSQGEVPENIAGYSIATFTATDADSAENGDVMFSLLFSDGTFIIHSLTGELTTALPLDFEVECYYPLYVVATDNGTTPLISQPYFFEVFVQPIEDIEPEFIDENGQLTFTYMTSTPENTPAGSIVIQVTAIDVDLRDCVLGEIMSGFGSALGPESYVIYSFNDSYESFVIDELTGEIHLLRALDYEDTQRHILTILATDTADLQAQATVIVNVLDRNDHIPQFVQPFYEATIPENTAVGSQVLQVTARDEDSLDQGRLVYSLIDNSPYFNVVGSNGIIYVSGDIDFESTGVEVIVSVLVTDSARNNATVTVTINIIDTNDLPPVINTQPEAVLFTEGQISLQPFPMINITDSDSFQHLCNATVQLYSSEETSTDTLDQCICTDITSGDSCTVGCLEFIQLSPASFPGTIVQQQGGFGLELIGNYSIDEYERALESIVYINLLFDPEPQPRSISLSVFDCQLPSNTLVQSIDIQPLNLIAPSLDLNGDNPGINYQTTFMERGNGVPIVSENVSISDDDLASLQKILTGIDIRLTNPQDSLESIIITSIPIGATIDSNSTHITISGIASLTEYTDSLKSAYYINLNSEPTPAVRVVEFVAHEYSLFSQPAYTEIFISTINDFPPSVIANPPHVNYMTTFIEGSQGTNIVASDAVIVDQDSTNDNVTEMLVYILTPESSDRLSIDGYMPSSITFDQPMNYSLSFTGSASRYSYESVLRRIQYQHTADEFTSLFPPKIVFIQIADHSLSGFTVIQVELSPVNDHLPEFIEDSLTLSVSENTTVGTSLYQLQFTDEDTFSSTEANFTIIEGGDSAFFSIVADTGVIILSRSLDHEMAQVLNFTVEITDESIVTTSPTHTVDSIEVTVFVLDQNDHVPMFTQRLYNSTIDEGAPIGSPVLQLSANDRDSQIHSIFEFAVINTTAFSVDSTGIVYTATQLDQETVSSYQFVVSVRNPGDIAADTADVFIVVSDINDHPPIIILSPESTTLQEPNTQTFLSSSLTINDGDANPSLDYAIVEVLGDAPGVLLATTSTPDITISGNESKSLIFIGASQSLSNYEQVLRYVVYEDTSEEPLVVTREIAYQVGSDPDSVIALNYSESETTSNVVVFQIFVEVVNDQIPVIQLDTRTLGSNTDCSYSTNYTEDSSPSSLSHYSLSITDADSGNTTLYWATVEVLDPVGNDESLHYSGAINVNVSYNHRLVLQGPASIAEFEAALHTVAYQTTSQKPMGDRQVQFTVNDGSFTSEPVLACVQLFQVNDAPVLTLGSGGSVDNIVMYSEGQSKGVVLAPQLNITGKFLYNDTQSVSIQFNLLFFYTDVDSLYLSSAVVALQGTAIEYESLEATIDHPDIDIITIPGVLVLQIVATSDQTEISSFVDVLSSITYTYSGQQ